MNELGQSFLANVGSFGSVFLIPMNELTCRAEVGQVPGFSAVLVRLFLAMLMGGIIGMERGRKNRPAGFRTYMLVCMSAAMTMMLGQYFPTFFQEKATQTDVSRIGAQVISGVGFLGAGTIMVTDKQHVKGLTTAAGLWTSACMGLALGAGFYICVLPAFGMILLVVWFLPKIEMTLVERSRNMDFYVEVTKMEGIHQVINTLKQWDVQIYDVDITNGERSKQEFPNGVFSIRLGKGQPHTEVIARLSHLETVSIIKEI